MQHTPRRYRLAIPLRSVRRLLGDAQALELSADAVQRLRWFLFALEHDGNVSLACRRFGIARTTFMRWVERFDPRDPGSLEDGSRRPHCVRQPEVDPHAVAFIRELRAASPLMSKQEISRRLLAERGLGISASTVGRVIARHGLFFADTPSHREKRRQMEAEQASDDVSPRAPRVVRDADPRHTPLFPLKARYGLQP